MKAENKVGNKAGQTAIRALESFLINEISYQSHSRGNAACIIGTAPTSEGLDEIFDYVNHKSTESSDQED